MLAASLKLSWGSVFARTAVCNTRRYSSRFEQLWSIQSSPPIVIMTVSRVDPCLRYLSAFLKRGLLSNVGFSPVCVLDTCCTPCFSTSMMDEMMSSKISDFWGLVSGSDLEFESNGDDICLILSVNWNIILWSLAPSRSRIRSSKLFSASTMLSNKTLLARLLSALFLYLPSESPCCLAVKWVALNRTRNCL